MSNKFKKGEIATILTIATVIFLGASTLISSVFLKDQKQFQTTTTKATDTDSGYHGSCVAPYPPISQDTKYTPTGYRWKADCSKSCNTNSDCPKSTDISAVNPETSNWCYGFSDGMKCMMVEKIPGAPIYTCPDGGIPKGNGDCEYGYDALKSEFYIEQGSPKCGSCILVIYSGGFPYGGCRYSNADVCRPSDPQDGCRGVCNRNCCQAGSTTQSGELYEKSHPAGSAGSSGLPPGGANPTIPGGGAGGQGGSTSCSEGEKNKLGVCDPACCDPSTIPNTKCLDRKQSCSIQNGYCKSGYSCGGGSGQGGGTVPPALPTKPVPTPTPTILPDNCVPKDFCDNFAYTLNLTGGNFECRQCYSDPSKYLLVNLTPAAPIPTEALADTSCKLSLFTTSQSNNLALSNVKINVYKDKHEEIDPANPPSNYIGQGETDKDGIFISLFDYSQGWVTVVLQKDGYSSSKLSFELKPPSLCSRELSLLPVGIPTPTPTSTPSPTPTPTIELDKCFPSACSLPNEAVPIYQKCVTKGISGNCINYSSYSSVVCNQDSIIQDVDKYCDTQDRKIILKVHISNESDAFSIDVTNKITLQFVEVRRVYAWFTSWDDNHELFTYELPKGSFILPIDETFEMQLKRHVVNTGLVTNYFVKFGYFNQNGKYETLDSNKVDFPSGKEPTVLLNIGLK